MSARTQQAYGADLARFLSASQLTIAELCQLSTGEVVAKLGAWRVSLSETLAASSCNRKLAAVRSFFRWLIAHGHAPWPVAPAVANLRTARPARPAVSRELVTRILTGLDGSTVKGARDVALIRLFWDLGLRLSEALELKCDDLRLDAEPPTIVISAKGGGRQQLQLPASTAIALGRVQASNGALLFALGRRAAQRRIAALGLLSPHALRRGGATAAHASGISLRSIQDYLRHESLNSTAQYVRHDPATAALRVSEIIAITPTPKVSPLSRRQLTFDKMHGGTDSE